MGLFSRRKKPDNDISLPSLASFTCKLHVDTNDLNNYNKSSVKDSDGKKKYNVKIKSPLLGPTSIRLYTPNIIEREEIVRINIIKAAFSKYHLEIFVNGKKCGKCKDKSTSSGFRLEFDFTDMHIEEGHRGTYYVLDNSSSLVYLIDRYDYTVGLNYNGDEIMALIMLFSLYCILEHPNESSSDD